jgi:hypothetical protein
MMMLEPANVGRDGGGACLDPTIVGIHRGMGLTGLTGGIVEIQTDIGMKARLVALQGQRVVAALIDDLLGNGALRGAAQPMTTRQLAERIIRVKALPMADDRQRELVQKTILGSLNRAKETIVRVEAAGVVSWRLG